MPRKDCRTSNLIYVTPFLASGLLLSSGCGNTGPASDDLLDRDEAPVTGGIVTTARPEVGQLSHFTAAPWCSAELIAPQWGFTACHCLANNARSRLEPPNNTGNVHFRYKVGSGPVKYSVIDRVYTTGSTLGAYDLSLFHLSFPVTDVTPLQLATTYPNTGTQVTAFGYGCNAQPDGGPSGLKRYRTFTYGTSGINCSGDSGGAAVLGGLNGTALFGVLSGFAGGVDVYGDAVNIGAPMLLAAKKLLNTSVTNAQDSDLADTAAQAQVRLIGDFDDNESADLAFVTPSGHALAIYLSNSDGTFNKVLPIPNPAVFASLVHGDGVRAITGNFDGINGTDFALVGGQGWNTVPVTFSIGNGSSFHETNGGFASSSDGTLFNSRVRALDANDEGAQVVVGDFDGDNKSDIAVLGPPWNDIPIAFSQGDGSFALTNIGAGNAAFVNLVPTPGAKLVVGDFDGDGADDLALVGGSGWNTLPVAYSNRDGSFTIENRPLPHSELFALAGQKASAGDFDGDGFDDILVGGHAGGSSIHFAFSPGASVRTTGFTFGNFMLDDVPALMANGSSIPLAGDVNHDGRDDLVLTGPNTWTSVPITFFRN